MLAACSGDGTDTVALELAQANGQIGGFWIGSNTDISDQCTVEFGFDNGSFTRINGNRVRSGSYTLEKHDDQRFRLNLQDISDLGEDLECVKSEYNAPGIDYSYVVEFSGQSVMEFSHLSSPDVIIGEFISTGD